PIDIVAPADARPAVDAALAAVLAQRVLAPVPGRAARVIIAPSGTAGAAPSVGESQSAGTAEAVPYEDTRKRGGDVTSSGDAGASSGASAERGERRGNPAVSRRASPPRSRGPSGESAPAGSIAMPISEGQSARGDAAASSADAL